MRKAVALKYEDGFEAPVIIAKTRGANAQKMIAEAEKQNVKIIENKTIVDMLGLSAQGNFVPPETWEILAQIFSVILQEEENRENERAENRNQNHN